MFCISIRECISHPERMLVFYFKVPVAPTYGHHPSGCETEYSSCLMPSTGTNVTQQVAETRFIAKLHGTRTAKR